MATRVLLYKAQNQINNEINTISEKIKNKLVRKAAVEETIKSLAKKWEEFLTNNEKLMQHGVNDDLYFREKVFENTKSQVESAMSLLQQIKMSLEEPEVEVKNDNVNKMIIEMQLQMQQQQEQHQKQMQHLIDQVNARESNGAVSEEAKEKKAESIPDAKLKVLINQFRRKVFKLRESLMHKESEENLFALEKLISAWERQIDDIRQLHSELSINYLMGYEIDEEFEEIDDLYDIIYKEKINKIARRSEEPKQIALKSIEIPCFSGKVEEWNSFHDLFKKLIHENHKLAEVQKLYYLKTNLKNEALRLIQHLPVTESNYNAAWEILKQRFGNERILFTKLVDKILDHPNINSASPESLKNLLDTTNECMHALRAMDINLQDADPFIARIVIRKLDKEGLILYEQNTKKSKEIQQLKDVMEFIEQHYQALEASTSKKSSNYKQQVKSTTFYTERRICSYCKKTGHNIIVCKQFLALPVTERHSWVKTNELCYNCLKHKKDKKCFSENKCQKCGMFHNTVIHLEKAKEKKSMSTSTPSSVLLATAQVRVKSLHNEFITLRALIDQGSQITSISEEAAQILQLPRTKTEVKLHGLGQTVVGVAKCKVNLEIHPRFLSNERVTTEALILPTLSSTQPEISFNYDIQEWNNFTLADPNFNKSDRIDIVIGADLYSQILEEGIHRNDKIVGQSTKFGWILSGVIRVNRANNKRKSAATTSIERFWEIEEIENEQASIENDYCLQLYSNTTERGEDGKFIVRLPFLDDIELGESYKRAMARFINLEKRLIVNTSLNVEYCRIMDELLSMGHMKKGDAGRKGKYYMPHQAVIRENSLTTKVRVVFDASSKTSNGKSLNDVLNVGPKLQKDIFDIITRWRSWKYVISADIEKMFRQININVLDQEYQYVLWRKNPSDAIEQYKLTTVTYGTAAAPFLAIRTLIEIANHCTNENIAKIIKEDFYMDDLLTGADTLQECKDVREAISYHLDKFGFHLRKWISNHDEIVHTGNPGGDNEILKIQEDECLKTLGLQWNPIMDCFSFSMQLEKEEIVSKRIALSRLAKIFDPLGWLTPVTITAKLFIQHLWRQQTDWDVPLDENLTKEWLAFTKNLSAITEIKINRWIQLSNEISIELHGFADASEKAYAAVVYAKIESTITIVAAKSKVNPIKNRKTLPKLELSAAHLLAKLMFKIKETLNSNAAIYTWSDSMITLAWIKNSKNKDKFIRTRVTEILSLIPEAQWRYVKSKENPADIASRGISAEKLVNEKIWWEGPEWLIKDKRQWPLENPVEALVAVTNTSKQENYLYTIINKFSSFTKLKRVLAYTLRFVKKLRGKRNLPHYLTTEELQEAEILMVKLHQDHELPNEMHQLKINKMVDHRSKLAPLHPQLDSNGVIRVGGRLEYANLPYNNRHPIIIQKSALGDRIIKHIHVYTMHGGNRLMENTIRKNYWIIGAKNSIKKCIRSCTKCIRFRHYTNNQLMGMLPHYRVNANPPFTHCGIDYAGPVHIKCSNGRGQKSMKGYIAIFVCMTTKAVHFEAVSSLTTEAFLAALRRFFGRRGKSSDIYSDNGTNFVGAARQLDKDFIEAIKNNSKIAPILENEKTKWHFIPPASPHMGGIWEAAVKSMKFHIKRIIGENKLTYEELSTLLAQIEAVLNSRPIHELNSNADELEVLTPGHFLIGRAMIGCPEKYEETKINCLDRWKLLQKMKDHFWKQWKSEYLCTLQQRSKWRKTHDNIVNGQVVIIKNEDSHPARWPLARVIDVHPGKDGLVRVVTLKTQNGITKRPTNKLCPLEHHDDIEELSTLPIKEVNSSTAQVNITMNQPKKKKFALPIILLLNLLFIMTTHASTKVHSIQEKTLMYLDSIGQINVAGSSWNIIIYYEMKTYFETLEKATDIIGSSKEICPKINTFKDQCWAVLNNMEYKMNKIKTANDLLNISSRKKREAPLKFIGSLHHVLFGLMDEDDRQALENNMNSLLENQHNLKELSKKQTSVVDSTVNLLKRTTEEVNTHFDDMRSKIKNISDTVRERHFEYRESIRFFMVTKQLHDIIDECSEVQKEAIDLLLNVNNGKIHPVIISPQQLQAEINRIRDTIPDKFMLPGKRSGTELKEIWHLLTGTGTFLGSQLIINLKIPLFNRPSSQIYKIIPVPFVRDDVALMARIKAPYIVYNYEMDAFHFLTDAVLNECKQTLSEEIVCEENFPWMDAASNECELSPLKPHTVLNCSFDEADKVPFWVELSTRGNWLYKVFKNTSAHIKCLNQQQTIMELPRLGILALENDCTARIEGITLAARHNVRAEFNNKFHSFLTRDAKTDEIEITKPLGNVLMNHNREISQLKGHVDELKKQNIELRGISFHHIAGHTSLILVLIVIIILIMLCIRRLIKIRQISAITFAPPQNVQL